MTTGKSAILTRADVAAWEERQEFVREITERIRVRERASNRKAFAPPDEGMSLDELERMVWPDAPARARQAREDKAANDEIEELVDMPTEVEAEIDELLEE